MVLKAALSRIVLHLQCLHYKILPSGLCAELCCKRGRKGLLGRIGTFSGPILEQIGTFYRYLHQNAELLKIMRKHDNSISRMKKFTKILNHLVANIHIFVAPRQFLHSTRNFNSLGPIYSSIMTNQTTSGLERQIGPFWGPYLDIGNKSRNQDFSAGTASYPIQWF